MNTIYPIILEVSGVDRRLRGRDKVLRLSCLARRAVRISAEQVGVSLGELNKSPQGVPLPVDGYFWSLAHKTDYVAGVVADFPIGMDIEKIRPCQPGLYRMAADEAEWNLGETLNDQLFFRYWTAKEAVLKSVGVGLTGLSRCRVIQIVDEHHLMMSYNFQKYAVEHFYFDGHISSVLSHPSVRWMVAGDSGAPGRKP